MRWGKQPNTSKSGEIPYEFELKIKRAVLATRLLLSYRK